MTDTDRLAYEKPYQRLRTIIEEEALPFLEGFKAHDPGARSLHACPACAAGPLIDELRAALDAAEQEEPEHALELERFDAAPNLFCGTCPCGWTDGYLPLSVVQFKYEEHLR